MVRKASVADNMVSSLQLTLGSGEGADDTKYIGAHTTHLLKQKTYTLELLGTKRKVACQFKGTAN